MMAVNGEQKGSSHDIINNSAVAASYVVKSWDSDTVRSKLLLYYVNKCPTRCNYIRFILSVNCSTCYGRSLHPSSEAQITVYTASGTGQPLLLPVGIVGELRLQSQLLQIAVSTPPDCSLSSFRVQSQFLQAAVSPPPDRRLNSSRLQSQLLQIAVSTPPDCSLSSFRVQSHLLQTAVSPPPDRRLNSSRLQSHLL